MKKQKRIPTHKDLRAMKSLRQKGCSYLAIGKKLGFAPSTVRNNLNAVLYRRRLNIFLNLQAALGLPLEEFEEGFIGIVLEGG